MVEEEEEEKEEDDRPPTVTTQKGWSKRRDGLFSMRVRACRHEGGRRRLSRQSWILESTVESDSAR
ncbi:hypothetical protein LTR40_014932, partial [Exophiala xenobiotica]